MSEAQKDPYTVVLSQGKIPYGLLTDPYKHARMKLLSTESFSETFGSKSRRKRPKLSSVDMEALASSAQTLTESYDPLKDSNLKVEADYREEARHAMFLKGQSKRIWTELYKVVDCSDVVIQVLDARDPMGTRCAHIERYLKRHAKHKNLIFVLNKCDLVPTGITRRWVQLLSQDYPTLAFHASITNPFGKGALIQLLRQLGTLHADKRQISVGFIGYPNVGKSSIINTLRKERVCKAAPIPGETKVWQYITLFRRILLIDCPGVVYPSNDTETDTVLKGVVRIENLQDAALHIDQVLHRVKTEYLCRTYGLDSWTDSEDFLTQIARKTGKLLKGGEPDLNGVARKVLSDWQRGRLPWFVGPPANPNAANKGAQNALQVSQLFNRISVNQELQFSEQDLEAGAPAADEAQPDAAADNQPDWDNVYANVEADVEEGVMPVPADTLAADDDEEDEAQLNQSESKDDEGEADADADEEEEEEEEGDEEGDEEEEDGEVDGEEKEEEEETGAGEVEPEEEEKKAPVQKGKKKQAQTQPATSELGKKRKVAAISVKKKTLPKDKHRSKARRETLMEVQDSDSDSEFWNKKGTHDLYKLNTRSLKAEKPAKQRTKEQTQKRVSYNRRNMRLCA
eukprot:TRINITY_DN1367_c0_g1_i1.p1 TRINITY_DN1367_c0_g1~~TRINITY_DN1367_c0_g1_i1.p1  ORF type:complete len:627 (+),score=208.55 TRINITY_DN1367_c0_g1_i1:553-2433(+)